jgi:hypothetical protein
MTLPRVSLLRPGERLDFGRRTGPLLDSRIPGGRVGGRRAPMSTRHMAHQPERGSAMTRFVGRVSQQDTQAPVAGLVVRAHRSDVRDGDDPPSGSSLGSDGDAAGRFQVVAGLREGDVRARVLLGVVPPDWPRADAESVGVGVARPAVQLASAKSARRPLPSS